MDANTAMAEKAWFPLEHIHDQDRWLRGFDEQIEAAVEGT